MEAAMTRTSRKLRKARELISDPKKWGKGSYEKDGRYCALGAVYACGGGAYDLDDAALCLGGYLGSAISFNDTHSHDDVLALFDWAIAFEEVGSPGVWPPGV